MPADLWARVADILDPPAPPDPWAELGIHLQPKQQLVEDLATQADETLFGGAAGGGKSYWLLPHCIIPLLAHPGTQGLILRAVRPSLRRSIWPKAVELAAGMRRRGHEWRTVDNEMKLYLPNGSVLEFAGLDNERDVHRYQGAEYIVVGWEELTEFSEYSYTYMLSRVRSPIAGVRPHFAGTTNPGGRGHSWVKARFVRPPEWRDDDQTIRNVPEGVQVRPCEIWRPCPDPSAPDVPAPTRVYVPATLADNPALTDADPGYLARLLAGVSAAMRQALTYGDWDAIDMIEGALFGQAQIDADRLDPTAFDPTAGAVITPDGVFQLTRRIVMVDPAVTHGPDSDDTGITVQARGVRPDRRRDQRGFVLADLTCHVADVEWARRAIVAWRDWRCDEIVIENNQGGDLLRTVVLTVARQMRADGEIRRLPPVRLIRARSDMSKVARARPVAVLYSQHRIHHVGTFPKLEDQLTTWNPDLDKKSPDRLDTIAHGFTHLGLVGAPAPDQPKPPAPTEEARRRARSRPSRVPQRGVTGLFG